MSASASTSTPDYVAHLRAAHGADLKVIDAERSILRAFDWGRGVSPYGLGYTEHLMSYLSRLCPRVEQNPWLWRMARTYEETRLRGKKICNLIGSQSSGKTDWFATFLIALTSIDPAYTKAYCASPYLTAADSGMWGRTLTRMHGIKSANPEMWAHVAPQTTKNRVAFPGVHAEGGFVELRTIDKVGKLQGSKSYDPDRGMLLLVCDEIALFPGNQLLDLLDNLGSNGNFFCYTGCNYKGGGTLDEMLADPVGRDFADLDPEADHEWDSAYDSYTVRFDGHRSPNILEGRTLYPYLLTEGRRAAMEEQHGLGGPKYLEQIRSFPNTSMSDYFVTSRDKLRAGGVYDEFVYEAGSRHRVAFCDPGFGGDPCKVGAFEFCEARLQATDGSFRTHQIFQPTGPIETLKVDARMVADEDWEVRLRDAAGGRVMIRPGEAVTLEQQIAVQCSEFLNRNAVAKRDFGFDGSMRASIVQEMIAVLGGSVTAMDFGGRATDRETDIQTAEQDGRVRYKKADEVYFNFVTELWFNIAVAVQAGQLRGGEKIPAALGQLCRRAWKEKGDRKQIEPKADFKAANNQRSPDDADVLVGAYQMALGAGFSVQRRRTPTDGASMLKKMIDRAVRGGGKSGVLRRTAKKLRT